MNKTTMKFYEIAKIEPRLMDLLREAQSIKDMGDEGESFCANEIWYDNFKGRLSSLVGWSASDQRLKSSSAYDAAYRMIYNALPDCRNCSCIGDL